MKDWMSEYRIAEVLFPKPFTLYNAGPYDYKMVKDLPWEKYREFVLPLFQCRDEPHKIAGVELDGYLGANSVMVFNYKEQEDVILDREFIDDLHKIIGDKVGYRSFIITPAASVMFFKDYIKEAAIKIEKFKKNDWEVHFDVDKIAGQMMIIYIDILGNEKREVKRLGDFRGKGWN